MGKIKPRQIEKLTYKIQEEEPDIINHFVDTNKTVPSLYRLTGPFIFKELGDIIQTKFDDFIIDWEYNDTYYKQVVYRVLVGGSQIFIKNRKTYETDRNTFIISEKSKKKYANKRGYVITTEVDIFYDREAVDINKVIAMFEKIKLKHNTNFNKIHLICRDPEGGLYTKEYPLINNGEYTFDLDLHYGDGFAKFHEANTKRIMENSKGIILMHGSPGTGKSYYIKKLILDLVNCKSKKILYLPNNIVELLGTPDFNNFLLEFIEDSNDDEPETKTKRSILIIVEDAERVLIKRENNPYGSDGVANILNSTDGILNDFLAIQVLATFNSNIKNIDEAILRKKRALSIREFRPLTKVESQRLIDHLGLKYTADGDMCLADIYALMQDDDDKVLFEENKKPSGVVGFKK